MKRRARFQAVVAGVILFGLAVACQFVAVTYGAGGEKPPKVVLAGVPPQDRARLRIIEDVPVARLSGTPFEMGRQHGVLFKKQIHFLYHQYFEALAVPAVGRKELHRWATKVEPFIPKHLREELRGLAKGCEMSYDETLMINAMIDRLQSMMCSTVVASGRATKDGEIYFGRNLDFPGRNFLHRATIVLIYEPKGGTRLVSVTWPGLIGVLSGMNEHGVAGATMMIHQGNEIRPGLPYMMMYREALTAARKTGDVFETIRTATRTCPNNFMVVDSTGAAEVIEWDQDIVARRSTKDGGVCSTNHFRTSKLAGTGWKVGTARYRTLSRFLEDEHGDIDLAGIKQALKDVAKPWFLNVQAMIFLPARQELHVAVGDKLPAAGQRWVHLERDVLFPK